MDRLRLRHLVEGALTIAALLGFAIVLVTLLETAGGVPDASSAFLLAVIASAAMLGTAAAVVTALGAFLGYDFLFVEPRFMLTVRNSGEWLNLLVLLVVGIVVARLTGALRDRAHAAIAREREALALFRISRALATRATTRSVLGEIATILATETGMDRVWIGLDPARGTERIVADSLPEVAVAIPVRQAVLRRMPGDQPAQWVRVNQPSGPLAGREHATAYRVRIEGGGQVLGSIWGRRDRAGELPDRSSTRLLSTAADQVGQALEQDRFALEARQAEVARQSDALKSALLESVSHDLRTPLASIRAAAGMLLDREVRLSDEDRAASAETIDREAEHLNRLVTNLLDLSRIEGGALRAEREPFELDDLVERSMDRLRGRIGARGSDFTVEVPADLPPVLVDSVLLDQVLVNLIENELKYVPPAAPITLRGRLDGDRVVLTIEDGGPGVPADALPHLFEKFYRVRRSGETSRPGTGIGLAVVRGMTEAMGGRVAARVSALGGLAIDVELPMAPHAAAEASAA